jgi:hypothetical protein
VGSGCRPLARVLYKATRWMDRRRRRTKVQERKEKHERKSKERARPVEATSNQYPPISVARTRSLSPETPAISKTLRQPPHILSAHQLQFQC